MKQGILKLSNTSDRFEINFGDGSYNLELTSGDVIEVLNGSEWVKTSVEYYKGYYYTNSLVEPFEGQIVRI